MSIRKSTARVAVCTAAAALVLAGCSSATDSSGSDTADDAGKDTGAVGFILVGLKEDFGYNHAVYEGSE